MGIITFSENSNSQLIPFDDGLELCSFNSPGDEAKKWVNAIDKIFPRIVVIGLGSGFHIDELLNKFQGIEVLVIETRANLIGPFRAKFPNSKNVQIQIVENFGDLAEFMIFEELIHNNFSLACFNIHDGSFGWTCQINTYWTVAPLAQNCEAWIVFVRSNFFEFFLDEKNDFRRHFAIAVG